MFEPFQRNVDHDVSNFMQMFERAKVGKIAAIQPDPPTSALVCVDGSEQDPISEEITSQIKSRLPLRLTVIDARVDVKTSERAVHMAERLQAETYTSEETESFDQILDAINGSQAELVILPCPYGRDLNAVGPDSIGTVIDVMLSRSPVPLLVVREAFPAGSKMFTQISLVITGENEAAPLAAAKALSLLQPGGTFTLSLTLEEELYENFRTLVQTMNPDMEVSLESVTSALVQTHMRLHRGLQQAAREHNFKYDLQVRHINDVPREITQEHTTQTLQVLGLVRSDHRSQGVVNDRIRFSADPLLVVAVQG